MLRPVVHRTIEDGTERCVRAHPTVEDLDDVRDLRAGEVISQYMHFICIYSLLCAFRKGPRVRLTIHTDYALRVLLYLGAHEGAVCSIAEIARTYGISKNHLMKVVPTLAEAGFVTTTRGRNGGLVLGRAPSTIRLADVVRVTEERLELADCDSCRIAHGCALQHVLREAMNAFLGVLENHTLADLLRKPQRLLSLMA